MARFSEFTQEERNVIQDGLFSEAHLDPDEDPTFPPIVEIANNLLLELEQDDTRKSLNP